MRSQHLDVSLWQSRHRVLCQILGTVPEGEFLIERARRLGFPVDWHDPRVYPNRTGYSDYGATLMIAKDTAREEIARQHRLSGQRPDYLVLDAMSSRQAQEEATIIFNALRARQIYLSGYANGRYYTCREAMPWSHPPSRRAAAPAPRLVPRRSKRH